LNPGQLDGKGQSSFRCKKSQNENISAMHGMDV